MTLRETNPALERTTQAKKRNVACHRNESADNNLKRISPK